MKMGTVDRADLLYQSVEAFARTALGEYPNFCVRSGLRVIHGARESSLHRARFARAVDNSMVAC
jgi:hypothetical protein